MKRPLRIVLASRFLLGYPEGGGHWSAFLQHFQGLDALGHDVFWLELYRPDAEARDASMERAFARRMDAFGFAGRWAIGFSRDGPTPDLDAVEIHGADTARVRRTIADADLLWNFACAVQGPLLRRFRRRALIDGDPGIIQISAEQYPMGVTEHHVLFTAGLNVGEPDCRVPTLGRRWHRFPQFVHLAEWPEPTPPPVGAKYTSITQWNWGEIWHNGWALSVSKRDAYMQFVELPRRCAPAFELAANIDPNDRTGDVARLREAGWSLVDPHKVAASPEGYRNYIAASRAELCCPKPVYTELRTGWFSDRSACYLASGRPVIMQDTGIEGHLPLGAGLLAFTNLDMAVTAVESVESNYAAHSMVARQLAQDHLSATRVLTDMLEVCR